MSLDRTTQRARLRQASRAARTTAQQQQPEPDTYEDEGAPLRPVPPRGSAQRATSRPRPAQSVYPPLYEDEDQVSQAHARRSALLARSSRQAPRRTEALPTRQLRSRERRGRTVRLLRRQHPLLLLGIGMSIALLSWMLLMQAVAWTGARLDDLRYGTPRTYQTDAVVGHHDSPAHPSHFIVENWHAHVIVIEFPGGDPTKAVVYAGPTLFGGGQDETPVTVSFLDAAHNGHPEMILHLQGTQALFTNGSDDQFHPAGTQP